MTYGYKISNCVKQMQFKYDLLVKVKKQKNKPITTEKPVFISYTLTLLS